MQIFSSMCEALSQKVSPGSDSDWTVSTNELTDSQGLDWTSKFPWWVDIRNFYCNARYAAGAIETSGEEGRDTIKQEEYQLRYK